MSIAILVCTGPELVSALHVGKTNYSSQKGYNATDNVDCFVKNFFPIHAREIPRLMWEGVRNGVAHLFIPKAMMCGQNRLNLTFVLDGQSQVTKESNKVLLT